MRSEGWSLPELIAVALLMAMLTSATVAVMTPTAGAFHALPEAADVQQRLRVAVEAVRADLEAAGNGALVGRHRGGLVRAIPPVLPYRIGVRGSDVAAGVYYRPNVVSVLSAPTSAAQVVLRDGALPGATLLAVTPVAGCPPPAANSWCGFRVGAHALVFDGRGAWDTVTVVSVEPDSLGITKPGGLAHRYHPGAVVVEIRVRSYGLRADAGGTPQLSRYDGFAAEFSLVENTVLLEFEYLADPVPPERLSSVPLDAPMGPWTTYGPSPPPFGVDDEDDSWPAGENCVFRVVSGEHQPRLPRLGVGAALVLLRPSDLTDGPWCPTPEHAEAFDADLLRIRRVRVRLRVQATMSELRGQAGFLFARGGRSTSAYRFVPDQEIEFDVAPPNLLGLR